MAVSFVLLSMLDLFRMIHLETAVTVATIRILMVLILSGFFLGVRIKLKYVSLSYSLYYVLVYISLIYLPRITVASSTYDYVRSEFLVHLFVIIGQGIRPGLFTGFFIFSSQLTYLLGRFFFAFPLALHHSVTELIVLFLVGSFDYRRGTWDVLSFDQVCGVNV